MIQLHATRKLFEKLPLNRDGLFVVTPQSAWLYEKPRLDMNPLSGWHANVVTIQRRQCVFFVHNKTRFPLVLPALTKPDFAQLNARFLDAFINTLMKCGATPEQLNTADLYMRPLQVDTVCSRSEQGTLNRMSEEFKLLLEGEHLNVSEMTGYSAAAWLADTPRTIKGAGYVWPIKEMFAGLDRLQKVG